MFGNQGMFTNLDNFQHSVKLGNNNRMSVVEKGTVRLLLNGLCYVVQEVYYVSELNKNLLSLG